MSPAATGDMTTFSTPFDATPNPAGDTVYFTAIGPDGPGVFRVPAAGGAAVTTLYDGPLLTAPFSIATSTDGQMLFITDTGAEDMTNDAGRIFTLPNDGGMPAPLMQADAFKPRAIEIHAEGGADQIYFTGTNATGEHGIFTMPAAGGAVTEVAKGSPFQDPSGIAIAANGDAYVCDTQASPGGRASILVKYATEPMVATIAAGLGVGYPCGVALSGDDATLFVSGIDPVTGKGVIFKVATTTPNTVTTQSLGDLEESAGLHRAKCANVFAWADSKANAGGTVFVLQP
jgi:sugar lactone lactonase YvrE